MENGSPQRKKLKLSSESISITGNEENIIKKDQGRQRDQLTQELDKEDSQIVSSLPRYLNSIFGTKQSLEASDDEHTPPLFLSPDINGDKIEQCNSESPERMKYVPPPNCKCLASCNEVGELVSVLALIIQVNAVTEVIIKNGVQAGKTVPMASILISDPTQATFKLSLWREASTWSERLSSGDIILLSNIRIKKWRKEVVGHTIMLSKLLNLHQPRRVPCKIKNIIPENSFAQFFNWAKKEHFYLFDKNLQQSKVNVKFYKSSELHLLSESIVHFKGKLINMISNKVLLLVDDDPYNEVLITLIGKKVNHWLAQLKNGVGKIWEIYYLTVLPEGTQAGHCYLQSTSRTYLNLLDSSFAGQMTATDSVNVMTLSLNELHNVNQSGRYCVTAKSTSMRFVNDRNEVVLDMCTLVSCTYQEIVTAMSQCIYIGCSICTKRLHQDINDVYCLCINCTSLEVSPSSLHYFNPMVVVLSDVDTSYVITVSSATLRELLPDGCEPEVISSSIGNHQKMDTLGEILYQWISKLMMSEGQWTVCVNVSHDENSFIESIRATLLDYSH